MLNLKTHWYRGFRSISRALRAPISRRTSVRIALLSAFSVFLLLSPGESYKGVSAAQAPAGPLAPTDDHRRATSTILRLMQRFHYKPQPLSDALSSAIMDRYLEALDPQKSFLLAADVEALSSLRGELDDALRGGDLAPAFLIFARYKTRVRERSDVALKLLQREFDFGIKEEYQFNREDADWPHSRAALDELWRKRVKNDVLGLRLAGREKEQIETTLKSRYERMSLRVTQLKANDIYQLFVNSYTAAVEPHTTYFSPRASDDLKIRLSLSLEGIGAALQTEDEFTVIRRIIAGGPASRNEELHVNDRIVGVGQGNDGEIVDVVSWRLTDVVDLIRGPKGSTVKLRVLPEKSPVGSPTKVVAIVRDRIDLEDRAAQSSTLEFEQDGRTYQFGIIDVPTFYLDVAGRARGIQDYRSTSKDVRKLIGELVSQGIDGLIIDLRGNAGGALPEAINLSGLFIESGPIVQVRGSDGRVTINEDEDPSLVYAGPMAVIVDRGSASASEIFAGAMQDYRRAVIVGEPTFGKGTVQNLVNLDRGQKLGQLKLTIAQFFRVNGDGTQHRGIVPDVVFPTAIDSDAQGERGYDNALSWAQVKPVSYPRWSNRSLDFDEVRRRHKSRVSADERFKLLLEELERRRELRDKTAVSLLERDRKSEWDKSEGEREKRDALYRTAFGLSGNESEDDEEKIVDVILEETGRVLADHLTLTPPPRTQASSIRPKKLKSDGGS